MKSVILLITILFVLNGIGESFKFQKQLITIFEDMKHVNSADGLKKSLTNLAPNALLCMNGQCGGAKEVWTPLQALSKYDYTYKVHVANGNQAVVSSDDYTETSDGCSAMFTCFNLVTFTDDGKVSKMDCVCDEHVNKLFGCLANLNKEL